MAGLSYTPAAYGALEQFVGWFLTQHTSAHHACVIVPNRRVARELQWRFSEKRIISPRIIALGSITHADGLLLLGHHQEAREALLAVPNAMDGEQLRHHMVRCVMEYQTRQQAYPSVQRAIALSEDLLSLLEMCDEAGVELSAELLQSLAPAYFARHWRHASDFLGIIAAYIPTILSEHQACTLASQQRQFLDIATAHVEQLKQPCVLFGSTGSVPYVRAFMRALSASAMGHVIVPGHWDHDIEEGGAHFFTHQAVETIGCKPKYLGDEALPAASPRALLCSHEEEEARLITLLMREGAHTGEETLLITRDVGLMRRVAKSLAQHNIVADSPSIARMNDTACGHLLLHIARLLADKRDMTQLHALLWHPWVGSTDTSYAAWRDDVDLKVLRANSVYRGVQGHETSEVGIALDHWLRNRLPSLPHEAELGDWCTHILQMLAIAGLPEQALEQTSEWVSNLASLDAIYGEMHVRDFVALLEGQLQNTSTATHQPTHSNLRMLTPVEARLMHAERVIIGAFHDGVWGNATGNAWLNDSQLRALGLPTRAAGQSLTRHDIAMHVHAKECFFTRAAMVNHNPTLPYAMAHQYVSEWLTESQWHQWAQQEQQAAYAPVQYASACPTAESRPQAVPVRALEVLQQNPYQFYADHVLKLKQLQPYGPKPENIVFGTLAHRVMEMLANGEKWNAPLRDKLLQKHDCGAAEMPFWQARLDNIVAFANGWLNEQKDKAIACHTEYEINQPFTLEDGTVMALNGRIDAWFSSDHGAMVVDYKTGAIPKNKAVESGEYCQLTAYGMMLQKEQGQWPYQTTYLKLPDVKNAVDSTNLLWGVEDWQMHAEALQGLMATVQQSDTPFIARPMGVEAKSLNVYDGISRSLERQMNAA